MYIKTGSKKLFVLGSILAELGGINQAHLSYNHNLVHIEIVVKLLKLFKLFRLLELFKLFKLCHLFKLHQVFQRFYLLGPDEVSLTAVVTCFL
jgi:hypothetical protein